MSDSSIRLDLRPGAPYDYAPTTLRNVDGGQVRDRHRQGRYRVHCTAYEARTMQEQVVYEGVDGADAGKFFVCVLGDFAVPSSRR